MPVIGSSDLTRLRTTQHGSILGLAVYVPAAIWTGRVNGLQTQGDTTIAVDGVSQVRAPQAFYRVWFGSTAASHDLGTAMFVSYGAPTLTVTAHNSTLPDNAYVTIYEVVPPEAVLPVLNASDITSENGTVAYTDGNTKYPPLATIGCPVVADLTTTTSIVKFFALPIAVAPGATITSRLWDFKDGTVADATIDGTAGTPLLVTFTGAGWRYISYTCTDSNGKTATRYIPVLVRAKSADGITYQNIEVSGIEGERGSHGFGCSVKVFATASETTFPEEALVILFAHDYFGTEEVSVGGFWTYRENIKLVGYIRRGTVKADALNGSVEFEIDGLGKFCEGLYATAFSLEDTTVPADWHQLNGLTNRLAAHHILTQHSTLSRIADCHIDMLNYANEFLDFSESSLQEQLTKLCDDGCGRGFWGSTAQGMIYLQPNPQLQAVADRTSYPIVITTTTGDLRNEVDLNDDPIEKCGQVDLGAVDAIGESFFSISPLYRLGHGTVKAVDETRCDSQAEANELAGNLFALENLSFNAVPLQWRGNYWVFDPFVVEQVKVNLAATTNARAIAWVNQICWTTRVSAQYTSGGVWLIDTVVERDSSGDPGTAPDDSDIGDFPTVIPPYPHTPPIRPSWIVPPYVPPTTPARALQTYDLWGGSSEAIANGTVIDFTPGVTLRAFSISKVGMSCPEDDGVSFVVTMNGVSKITASRTAGTWTVNAVTRGSADTILVTLSPIVSFSAGQVIATTLTAGAALTSFQFGLGM